MKKTVPVRAEVLHAASDLVCNDRNQSYGPPVENMQHIADIFNAWTGRDLTAREISQIHVCTKMARRSFNPKHKDSYVDGAGWTGIEYECAVSE